MDNKPSKEISRRDAFKILAAVAGATALANLPDKWTKPGMEVGVLPAHAQTSSILRSLVCEDDISIPEPSGATGSSQVTISPAQAGIVMRWTMVLVNANFDNPLSPNTGTVATNGLGVAGFISDPITSSGSPGSVTVTWSFENPADGSASCSQVISWAPPFHSLAVGASDPAANFCFDLTSTVTITPPTFGILMRYVITTSIGVILISPVPPTGTVPTNASGVASLLVDINNSSINAGDIVNVNWTFENDGIDGTGSDTQVFTNTSSGC